MIRDGCQDWLPSDNKDVNEQALKCKRSDRLESDGSPSCQHVRAFLFEAAYWMEIREGLPLTISAYVR